MVSAVVFAFTFPFAKGEAVRLSVSVVGSFVLVVVALDMEGRVAVQLYST